MNTFAPRLASVACRAFLVAALFSTAYGAGTEYLVEIQTEKLPEGADHATARAGVIEVLRKRVAGLGAKGVVEPEGANRVVVRLFNLRAQDKETARNHIARTGYLEFRLVHPQSDELLAQGPGAPGYEVLTRNEKLGNGGETPERVLVKIGAELGMNGSYVNRAVVVRDSTGRPEISFTLNPEGTALFAKLTRDNINRRLAIVLDGELYSAPVIRSEISGGAGQISGRFETREAFELAAVLENPLPAPLRIVEERGVDPEIERAYNVARQRKSVLLIGGVVAVLGVVVGGILYLDARSRRRRPGAGPGGPPPLPGGGA